MWLASRMDAGENRDEPEKEKAARGLPSRFDFRGRVAVLVYRKLFLRFVLARCGR
jgi:hypothetical protein